MDSISFQGFENNVITFLASGELEKGTPVTVTESGTVSACGSYDAPAGVVVACDGTYAAVCVRGVVTLPGDGSVSTGFAHLVINSQGKLSESDGDAPVRLVLEVDDTDDSVTFLL